MQLFNGNNVRMQLPSSVKAVLDHRNSNNSGTAIGPYSLVQLAYHGSLIKQGIPSRRALVEAHQLGHMSADLLVKCAVKAKLLSASALTDSAYLDAVETGFLLHYSL